MISIAKVRVIFETTKSNVQKKARRASLQAPLPNNLWITNKPIIHPEIEDEEAWKIHRAIKRLVAHHGIQEICEYLRQLSAEKQILLPKMPSVAYEELVRMGMPSDGGFNESTFRKYYLNK